ncbi:hypothetical protein [Frankia sp. Cj3]|uniref:hypothetical protein n=1 Tax=Frankia sp. Cj3 TaxID=2880976 RepID=UPI001EF49B6B|nr:hypothetical protein [Frankia sp. Cj3]
MTAIIRNMTKIRVFRSRRTFGSQRILGGQHNAGGQRAFSCRPSTRPSAGGRVSAGIIGPLGLAGLLCLTAGCQVSRSDLHDPAKPSATAHSTPAPAPGGTGQTSDGWTITVYYTAVESFHHGQPRQVTGCPRQDCAHGNDPLGTYPTDFVAAVHDEGTGRITSGDHAGNYLNWSYDTGYWLDTVPADTTGQRLQSFSTAAADSGVLAQGARFTVATCGSEEDHSAVDPVACARLQAATWTIHDEFTPGLGGDKHIDLYVGEEDRVGFTDSPLYLTGTGARITIIG